MAKVKEACHRYRFNVPDMDETTIKWLAAQINPSVSLRLLIKEDIADSGGISDVTCRIAEKVPCAGRRRRSTARSENVSQAVEEVKQVASEQMYEEKPKIEVVKSKVSSAPQPPVSIDTVDTDVSANVKPVQTVQKEQKDVLKEKETANVSNDEPSTKKPVKRVSALDMGLLIDEDDE